MLRILVRLLAGWLTVAGAVVLGWLLCGLGELRRLPDSVLFMVGLGWLLAVGLGLLGVAMIHDSAEVLHEEDDDDRSEPDPGA